MFAWLHCLFQTLTFFPLDFFLNLLQKMVGSQFKGKLGGGCLVAMLHTLRAITSAWHVWKYTILWGLSIYLCLQDLLSASLMCGILTQLRSSEGPLMQMARRALMGSWHGLYDLHPLTVLICTSTKKFLWKHFMGLQLICWVAVIMSSCSASQKDQNRSLTKFQSTTVRGPRHNRQDLDYLRTSEPSSMNSGTCCCYIMISSTKRNCHRKVSNREIVPSLRVCFPRWSCNGNNVYI